MICSVCGCELEPEECWSCGGEGGDYPSELSPCEYDEDEWETCQVCRGSGEYLACPQAEFHDILLAVERGDR